MRKINLLGNLSKVVNKADGGSSLEWVINGIDVDVAFIEEMMKDVDGFDSSWTLLLVAKYQINPLVQTCTDVVTLQRLYIDTIIIIIYSHQNQCSQSTSSLINQSINQSNVDLYSALSKNL